MQVKIAAGSAFSVPAVQANPARAGYYRPWRFIPAGKSGCSRIKEYGPKGLKIHLDVRQFPPDGITCKAQGKSVVVVGKHSEKTDKIGTIERQFTRIYKIPEDIDLKTLASKISRAGVLKITASKVKKDDKDQKKSFVVYPRGELFNELLQN